MSAKEKDIKPTGAIVAAKTQTVQQPVAPATPQGTEIPDLVEYWTSKGKNVVTDMLGMMNMGLVNKAKNVYGGNPHWENNVNEKGEFVDVPLAAKFSQGVSAVLSKLEDMDVKPHEAYSQVKEFFKNPYARKAVFGEKSLYNDPAFISIGKQEYSGSKNYEDNAIEEIANLYSKLKTERDAKYGVTPKTKVQRVAPKDMPSQVSGIAEKMKTSVPGVKIKVIKQK